MAKTESPMVRGLAVITVVQLIAFVSALGVLRGLPFHYVVMPKPDWSIGPQFVVPLILATHFLAAVAILSLRETYMSPTIRLYVAFVSQIVWAWSFLGVPEWPPATTFGGVMPLVAALNAFFFSGFAMVLVARWDRWLPFALILPLVLWTAYLAALSFSVRESTMARARSTRPTVTPASSDPLRSTPSPAPGDTRRAPSGP